jgi:hypothetical protein
MGELDEFRQRSRELRERGRDIRQSLESADLSNASPSLVSTLRATIDLLDDTQKKLAKSEQLVFGIFEGSLDAFVLTNDDYRFVDMSLGCGNRVPAQADHCTGSAQARSQRARLEERLSLEAHPCFTLTDRAGHTVSVLTHHHAAVLLVVFERWIVHVARKCHGLAAHVQRRGD